MTRTTSAQSVQAQNSTRKNTLLCQEPLYYFVCVYCNYLDCVSKLCNRCRASLTCLPHDITTQQMSYGQNNLCTKCSSPKLHQKKHPSIFDTSTLHLPLTHVFSPIYQTIHFNPLITTNKKNKIVSLLFNVELNIFTNSSSSISTPTSLHLCCNIYSF